MNFNVNAKISLQILTIFVVKRFIYVHHSQYGGLSLKHTIFFYKKYTHTVISRVKDALFYTKFYTQIGGASYTLS